MVVLKLSDNFFEEEVDKFFLMVISYDGFGVIVEGFEYGIVFKFLCEEFNFFL